MLGRWALIFTLSVFGLSPHTQAVAGTTPVRAKVPKIGKKLMVRKVRRQDGSVVVRLNMPGPVTSDGITPASSSNTVVNKPLAGEMDSAPGNLQAKNSQIMNQWLDAVTEPRFMTALAAVALDPGAGPKALDHGIDPAKVRNWAEFVDPDLYLRWKAGLIDPRFNRAILGGMRPQQGAPWWIAFSRYLEMPDQARPGVPLNPTIWSNAFSGGPGGQEAAQEWLKLPMPDPWLNPWLGPNRHSRY